MWLQVIYFIVLLVLLISSCSFLHEPVENRPALPQLPGVKSIEELTEKNQKNQGTKPILKNPKPTPKQKTFNMLSEVFRIQQMNPGKFSYCGVLCC